MAVLAIGILAVSHQVLVKGFANVEAEAASKNFLRLRDAISEQVDQLNGQAMDYAKWTDMYEYVRKPTKEFEQNNIIIDVLNNLDIDFMGVMKNDGTLLAYASRDKVLGKNSTFAKQLLSSTHKLNKKILEAGDKHSISGLLAVEGKVLCLATQPVLKSDGTGDVRGFVLMGSVYSPQRVASISRMIHLGVVVAPAASSLSGLTAKRPKANEQEKERTFSVNDDVMRTSNTIKDVEGEPSVYLAVNSPRSVYHQMLETRYWLTVSILVSGMLIFLVSVWLVDRMVIGRLVRLSQHTSAIAKVGDASQRVDEAGNDEIAKLAKTVNDMLGAIQTKTSEILQAQHALERSEKRYLQVIESTNAGIYEFNRIANRIKINEALRTILGWDRAEDEVGLEEIRERLHPDDRADLRDVIFENLNVNTTFALDLRVATQTGGYRWVHMTGKKLRDVDDQDVIVGSVVDITTKKQAELDLLKIYQLTELSDDFIAMADLNGNVTYVNPEGVAITGLDPRAEKVLPNIVQYYPDFEQERLRNEILPEVWTKGKWSGEIHFLTADRKSTLLMAEAIILIRDPKTNEPTCLGTVARDITLQRQAEKEMAEARDAALDLARVKASFLANMSHEIRTPMNGILGMVGLLADTPMNPEQRDYVKIIQNSAESLLAIINDILDFSKIEAGKLAVEEIPFNMRDLIEESVRLLAQTAHRKGIELICRIPPQLPDHGISDPTRIRQVLMNLIGNAIKFTEQGRVVVSAEQTGESANSQTIRIRVADTGIGIEPEKHAAIFESFTQADSSSSRKYGGTGLGLTISKQIVELLGGQIGLESALGQGSTFWFEVPVKKAPKSGHKPSNRKFENAYTVLAVDDDETNRLVYRENLKAWNINCIECKDGFEAVALLSSDRNTRFDAIVMDLQMPGMDGIQTVAAIREIPGCLDIPIVLATSSGHSYTKEEMADMGITALLHKPIIQSFLFDLLSGIFDGQTPLETPEQKHQPGNLSGLSVLLVEDNPVNRKVGVKTLEKAGASVVVAENGLEAIKEWQKGTFDCVLMDCQMPVMDGFEATCEIRRLEPPGSKRTPIVAMTAGTSDEDREKSSLCGMDAFLTKPIRPTEIVDALKRITAHEPSRLIQQGPVKQTVFDAQRLLDICDGDNGFFAQIVAEFENSTKATLEELERMVADGDLENIRRAAHRLKGASRNIGGERLANICEEMELCAKNGVDAGLDQTLDRIREAAQNLIAMLHTIEINGIGEAA